MMLRLLSWGIASSALVLAGCDLPSPKTVSPDQSPCPGNKYGKIYETILPLATGGEASSEKYIGAMYQRGVCVLPDPAKAAFWYAKAAAHGDMEAQAVLGNYYLHGYGMPRDDVLAFQWTSAAARQGDAAAERQLGLMYRNEVGTKADSAEALRWTILAAEQGNGGALGDIGGQYLTGVGVKPDYRKAIFWLTVAEAHLRAGSFPVNEILTARDAAAGMLTPVEAEEIRSAALNWNPGAGSLNEVRVDAALSN